MNSWSQKDKNLIWHPFTQEKMSGLSLIIERAEGAYLYDEHGNSYLDLISSWWVNLHGHANPRISQAIYQQAQQLEHVIFAGFSHKPAITLCNALKALLPKELTKFFFSDNGSTAIEVALKMAYQYWYNQGQRNRNLFICFEGSYHGDTFGSMSVSKSGFHNHFQKLCFQTLAVPFAATWFNDTEVGKKEGESLAYLKKILQQKQQEIAGLIIEPLVQGAGGMRICRAEYLREVVDIVKSYDIPVIFDEVMTGFGRTGSIFAFEQIQRSPDIICLSKALTGGFLPLALTVTTEKLYQAFLGNGFDLALAHGHSYTANPLGCAAAVTSLKLLNESKTRNRIQEINNLHLEMLPWLAKKHELIKAERVIGIIAAFNLNSCETNYKYEKCAFLKEEFLSSGLVIRPLGNVIYILPPYCITKSELRAAYFKISDILGSL